ncbi:MAG: CoA-transferase subunit beta [Chloroflexi bacterium]|nr:CoA-transferase subunit beta [Chloroflexota bacterium]
MTDYTPSEMMIVTAARALAGVRTVFVGVGLPNIACNLAQRTIAPALELIYESGVYGARPARLPLSIGDPTLISGATSVCSMADLFGLYLQGGRVEVAFLGGAQIDRFGNLNTTVIGDWEHPKVRLPGSGGACEIAINAQRVFVIMRLRRRAFVEQLHFLTSPGHLGGAGERTKLGLPGSGPQLVVTDRCVFRFDEETAGAKEMVLESLHPGVELAEVQAEVGWELKRCPEPVEGVAPCSGRSLIEPEETEPPMEEELRLLREELDPQGLYR